MAVGLVLCSCGEKLGETLDYEKIANNIENKEVKILQITDLCLGAGLEKLQEFIDKNKVDRVLIAACTPQDLEKKVEKITKDRITEFVCLREHCAWPHLEEKESATLKAIILINAAIDYLQLKQKVEKRTFEINDAVAVIGGGISGISAANILGENTKVYLIEKSGHLGGNLNNLKEIFQGSNGSSGKSIIENITQLKPSKNVETFLQSMITNIEGAPGNYDLTIEKYDGSITLIKVGAIILATGFEESSPSDLNLSYSLNPDILTQVQLSKMIKKDEILVPSTRKKPENVVMINCVGSRTAEKFYCSRVCCTYSIHNAIELVKKGIDTTIIYMDIRTPYKYEQIYSEAREKGVTFIRGNTQNIEAINGLKYLTVENTLSNEFIEFNPDLIVLATALIPSVGTHELADIFQLPIKESSFISELYGKTNSVQTMMKGVFVAGSAQFPMAVPDSISHAEAAALKALKFINKKQLELENEITSIDEELCIGCGNCAEVCLYNAILMEDKSTSEEKTERIARVIESKCKGCGTCSAICPSGATKLLNFDRDSLFIKIEGLSRNYFIQKGKQPFIISLTCKECAYCGIDLAGISDFQYSPNVFLVDIPCAGRIGPIEILKCFIEGADAVIVSRCPEKSCHYRFGNKNAKLVVEFTKNLLDEIGFDGSRLELLELISAEPDKFGVTINKMNNVIEKIGANPKFKR